MSRLIWIYSVCNSVIVVFGTLLVKVSDFQTREVLMSLHVTAPLIISACAKNKEAFLTSLLTKIAHKKH